MSKEEIYKKIFDFLDNDKDGFLGLEDLKLVYEKVKLPNPEDIAKKEIAAMNPGNTVVPFEKFAAYHGNSEYPVVFCGQYLITTGGDDKMTYDSMNKFMEDCGKPGKIPQEEFDILDKDHDGKITYYEFFKDFLSVD